MVQYLSHIFDIAHTSRRWTWESVNTVWIKYNSVEIQYMWNKNKLQTLSYPYQSVVKDT